MEQLEVLNKRVDAVERRVDRLEDRLDAVQQALQRDIEELRAELNSKLDNINDALRETTINALRSWPPSAAWLLSLAATVIGALVSWILWHVIR
ncbi:MAG: hypothetical protein ACPL5F_04950 [Moorellaceae bacterium]